MRLFNFQMSEELRRKAFAAAQRSGKTASCYVREAVFEKLEREDGQLTMADNVTKGSIFGRIFRVNGRADAYKKFCTENGEFTRSHKRLAQNMKERGFTQRNSSGRFWEGIKLIGE